MRDCLLNIAFPVELEEELIELLRAHPELVQGFTILPAEGFGAGTQMHTSMEKVRGRAQRRLVQLLLAQQQVAPLVEILRGEIPSEEIAWWTVAVSGFGRLA